jgi:hypothetical protein
MNVRRNVLWTTIALAVVAVMIATCWSVRSYGTRVMLQHERVYNAEMLRLYRSYERRLRDEIDGLVRIQKDEGARRQDVDRLFEMLRASPAASNSREVESWGLAPHSPERTTVALKWARVAADEAAFSTALHELWEKDYEKGQSPHHIMDDEVPPFRLPPGWTEDDLRYRRTGRDD